MPDKIRTGPNSSAPRIIEKTLVRTTRTQSLTSLALAAFLAACGATPAATPVSPTQAPTTAAPTTITATKAPAQPTAVAATATVASPLPTAAPVETVQPGTPLLVQGLDIAYQGVRFSIPEGVASGVSAQVISGSSGPDVPAWEVYPEHTDLMLRDYPAQNRYHQPRIVVYPVAEFEQMSEGAAHIIAGLRQLLAERPDTPPQTLPALPLFNAAQVFHAQVEYLDFENGAGVRFLTQYGQNFAPINNQELIYTFQGLTNDAKYYVAAILPVNAPFLANEERPDAPVPPGGIPFPPPDSPNFGEEFGGYLQTVARKLEETAPETFTPDLSQLDALVQSIEVGAP
jgi:hypothetical protein